MTLITDSKDERLVVRVYRNAPEGLVRAMEDINVLAASLRAMIAERDALHEAYTIQVKLKESAEAEAMRLREALEKIANYDWVKGERIIFGNEELPGDAGQFYRGYNSGIKGQFEATKAIAEAELRRCAGRKA